MFQFLASVVLCIIHPQLRLTDQDPGFLPDKVITDTEFLEFMPQLMSGTPIPAIAEAAATNKYILLNGFFQHDQIYLKYWLQIVDYIRMHPEFRLITDRGDIHHAGELLAHPTGVIPRGHRIVCHLRLEDFCQINICFSPRAIHRLLQGIARRYPTDRICLVLNRPTEDYEHRYLEYISEGLDVCIESNDVITDYHILREAEVLICSYSTLSWVASLLSETVREVYMPTFNYWFSIGRVWETFRQPIPNTIEYDGEVITFQDMLVELYGASSHLHLCTIKTPTKEAVYECKRC